MPKTSIQTENDRKDRMIREQLYGKMKAGNISVERMADILGVSVKTFYRLRNEPERMTVRDLRNIQRVFPDFRIE